MDRNISKRRLKEKSKDGERRENYYRERYEKEEKNNRNKPTNKDKYDERTIDKNEEANLTEKKKRTSKVKKN